MDAFAAAMAAPIVLPVPDVFAVPPVLPRLRRRLMALRMLLLLCTLDLPSYTLVGGVTEPASERGLIIAGSSNWLPDWVSLGMSTGAESARNLESGFFSGNLDMVGVGEALPVSAIPSCSKLKPPEPRVLTASSLPPILAGRDWLPAGAISTLLSAVWSSGLVRLAGLPFGVLGLMPVFMVLVRVFAAFCAAVNTVEKKPVPGVEGPAFSGIGVRGAAVMLESLLGPMLAVEPALDRLDDIIFPAGSTTTLGIWAGREEAGDDDMLLWRESVGVGGVLTIAGGKFSACGGVRGGAEVSMVGWGRKGRKGSLGDAATGSSAWWSKGGTAWARPVLEVASLLARLSEDFLLRKALRNLPAGDFDRWPGWSWGASRASLGSEGLDEFDGVLKSGDWLLGSDTASEWSPLSRAWMAARCCSWIKGDDVVKWPI